MMTGRIPRPDGPPRQPVPPHPWDVREPVAPPGPRSAPPPRQVRTRSRQFSCGPARREWMDDPHGERLSVLWSVKAVPHPVRTRPQKAFQGQIPLPVLPPDLRPHGGKTPHYRARRQFSCRPHGDAGGRSWLLRARAQERERTERPLRSGPPQVRARGKGRQVPSQRGGPLFGETELRHTGARKNRPSHRPRAAPPDRRPMTTGRIPRPGDPPRQPAPPHPWDAREPAAPPAPRSAPPLRQVQVTSRQFSCGPARRKWTNGAHGKKEPSLRQHETVPLPAQMPPLPPQTGQQKAPLPVWAPVLQPRTREPSLRRARRQPSHWPHGDAGQMSFSEGQQVREAWPQQVPRRQTGPPEGLPEHCRWQRPATHLLPAGFPHLSGSSCPTGASFFGWYSGSGKMPDPLPAFFPGRPPGPSRPEQRPALPFAPSLPSFPTATATAQDHRPPATRGPWP